MTATHNAAMCPDCRQNPETSAYRVVSTVHTLETKQQAMHTTCYAACTAGVDPRPCMAIDCPTWYTRQRTDRAAAQQHETYRTMTSQFSTPTSDPWAW